MLELIFRLVGEEGGRLRNFPLLSGGAAAFLIVGCKGAPPEPTPEPEPVVLQLVAEHEGAAFMAIHGRSADDVWAVGADDEKGSLILHYDGQSWTREDAGVDGDLWWVQAIDDGTTFFAGADSHLLKHDGKKFERLKNPGLGKYTIYGVWAFAEDDLYAVGTAAGRNGFIWHYNGQEFSEVPVPDAARKANNDLPPFFKVAGRAGDDVWVVGGSGVILRGNRDDGFEVLESGTTTNLFTVHASQDEVLVVGGAGNGLVLRGDPGRKQVEWEDVSPPQTGLVQGAWSSGKGRGWISGRDGEIYQERDGQCHLFADRPALQIESLHAIWEDPDGGVWAVGGNVISSTLDQGVILHGNRSITPWKGEKSEIPLEPGCPDDAVDPAPEGSIARRWNEQMLNAIRRDTPRPTVHARNLLHTSIAMWDAWSAYDEDSLGVVYQDKADTSDIEEAREEAISYASYRVLIHRYEGAIGGAVSTACFDAFMDKLGYEPGREGTTGSSARALGNRIGAAIIEEFADDGAEEVTNYTDPTAFTPDNPLLIVDEPGTYVTEPTEWQQLLLAEAVTQNGISEGAGVRPYVGGHWGAVRPFALERDDPDEPYFSGGSPPTVMDEDLIDAAVDIIRRQAELDVDDGVMMDISPHGWGNNSLGANDGTGYSENPVTGEPYESEEVLRGDFTRVLAEFWADGPQSETPPGHWNTLANLVADHPDTQRSLFGSGDELTPLSWDVHVYLALNGAVHDAAIAAWQLKRNHMSARPITLVRYLSGLGQSSDPEGPSYDAEGIPLVEDLIEVITEESSAPGERHAHLARYVGEITLRAWRGEPAYRDEDIGGVDWIRGADWIPYQRRTFVTPPFPGYVSGHSTFSRAAAEVLTEITGSPYFPGGVGSYELDPGYLVFEYGPSEPLTLMWATYYDASDQAGLSRLWGGIHIRNDDFDGRTIGSTIGKQAVALAQSYFDGSAP